MMVLLTLRKKAQVSAEYLILLGIVGSITIIGATKLLPSFQREVNRLFKSATVRLNWTFAEEAANKAEEVEH